MFVLEKQRLKLCPYPHISKKVKTIFALFSKENMTGFLWHFKEQFSLNENKQENMLENNEYIQLFFVTFVIFIVFPCLQK